MSVNKNTAFGNIDISLDAISGIVGESIKNVFGVVGLGTKRSITDNINVMLNKETYKDGVCIKRDGKDYIIDIYVVLCYGIKVSEVVQAIVSSVRYNLIKAFDLRFKNINVYVQDIVKM